MRLRTMSRRVAAAGAALALVGVTLAACSSNSASATTTTTASSSTSGLNVTTIASTSGTWPGVGKVCGTGTASGSTARGVSSSTIDLATFADPGNTVEPGLNVEFFQAGAAFAKWCNAAGGINGRKIVVHDHDGALFNGSQVMTQACQTDFMSVGGGLALDQSSTPIRVACGLGAIPAIAVSSQAVDSALQVNPMGTNNHYLPAGWYAALKKKYPSAVKKFGIGGPNEASFTPTTNKDRDAAVAQGYKVVNYQAPPLSVTDWTPWVQQAQSAGVQALQPSDDQVLTPYVQAMNTLGYNPTFMYLGPQFYNTTVLKSAAQAHFPTTYVTVNSWPFELASQSPGLKQMQAIMKRNAPGDAVDSFTEYSFGSWLLWAKSATACGSTLTDNCVLTHAASQTNWSGGGLDAPTAKLALSNQNPQPSSCFALMDLKGTKFVYDRSVTKPNNQIWNCGPKNVIHLPKNYGG
jgi:ABC-type branched-subunit amino acid transport system substrate-binding protein